MWKNLVPNFSNNNDPVEWSYEDIPTPKTETEFIKEAQNALAKIQESINDHTRWSLISFEDDILLDETKLENSGVVCVRATTTLERVDVERLIQDQFNPNFDARKAVYDETIDHHMIKKFDENTVLSYSQYKSPPLVTNRDFVCIWSHKEVDNTHIFSIESVNYQEVPFAKNFVRGTTSCGALLAPDEGDKYRFVMIEHIDPRGWVPGMVINLFKSRVLERISKIREIYCH